MTGPPVSSVFTGSLLHYRICNEVLDENVVVEADLVPEGWVSLGKFDFSVGEVQVILDDRGGNIRMDAEDQNLNVIVSSTEQSLPKRQLIIADAVKLWDNGTRVNEQPGPDVNHPGVAQAGVVTEVKGTDSEGHNYLAASSLLQVSLTFDAAQSLFTCTISNISAGTANETPFSGGVFVVSNLLDGDLVMDKPFFSVDQKSGVELTKLAEAGNVDPLKSLVADQTGIITTLHGAIVVVYTGNTNPIYQLGQKDAQLGLAALAQRGDPSQLKASLEKVPQVRKIYTLTDTVLPGKSMECTYEAAANEKVAFATMFGYSNDWFFANGPELNALTKGEVTNKTVLLDDGTAVSQYPGAGNAQFVFGGTRMPEDKAISAVGDTFPVPAVDGIVKITIY